MPSLVRVRVPAAVPAPAAPMSRALAALAARTVGRRVRLAGGLVGTVTRVTSAGMTVAVTGVTARHIERWVDD